MTIHSEHPFADPTPDPVRQLRGRLGGTVTLWTAGDSSNRAGLTVSSVMVARGEPDSVVALIDPDSALAELLDDTHTAVMSLLNWEHRDLAEMFAGTAPAPGGAFAQSEFVEVPGYGFRPAAVTTWAALTVASTVALGWSSLITARIDDLSIAPQSRGGLGHYRGRFHQLPT